MSEEDNSKQIENGQDPNDKEQAMIWDLEVWKRAQQAQFKAYLKHQNLYIFQNYKMILKVKKMKEKENLNQKQKN